MLATLPHTEFLPKPSILKVTEYLRLADVPYEIDKRLVRGLDYYTRTAWESDRLGSGSLPAGTLRSISRGAWQSLRQSVLPPDRTYNSNERLQESESRHQGAFIQTGNRAFQPEAFRLSKTAEIGLSADTIISRSFKSNETG
jgi:hypothetical protein